MAVLLRTFVAVHIKPAPSLMLALNTLKQALSGEPAIWQHPGRLHLTLKFLGDTLPSQVDEISEEINQVARYFSSFSFQLKGLGYFKNKGMPRVLFAKITEGQELRDLASEISFRLGKLGFEPETRPFNPHLTLARIKFLKNRMVFYREVNKFEKTIFQDVAVSELIFYKSILKPEGPEYQELNIFKLK